MFKVPEQYRCTPTNPQGCHPMMLSDETFGNAGVFQIPLEDCMAFIIASDGLGWEHVSVHIVEDGEEVTPTWDEMCAIKDFFWGEQDCVLQYHPPKSEYVNQHAHTLHLWRPTGFNVPVPASILVGTKKKQ